MLIGYTNPRTTKCKWFHFNVTRPSVMFNNSCKILKSFIHAKKFGLRGKQWNTEGNVDRDKKGGFRKRTLRHKREIIYCNNNEIIGENNSTNFSMRSKTDG